jgi:acyl-CoA synthetase (NDP forming)/RimJ/RimL family protein N-acetyltransferase
MTSATFALLMDGSTIEIRPAMPQDEDAVRQMYAAMSPENTYLRFFSLSPVNAEREAKRACREPSPDHVSLLAWLGDELAGVAGYESVGTPGTAEIAFAVPDHLHGRGIATLLLEHLVSIARQHQVKAFTAETLTENTAMLQVFANAGLPVRRKLVDGDVQLTFPLPRDDADRSLASYLESVAARESRADVASLRHLLRPGSVAVIGASRHRGSPGREILHNIVTGGFAGAVYAVNPHGQSMEGLHCLPSVADLPEHVDVAMIAVPAPAVPRVAAECGRRGVRSLVVITSGLGAAGADLLAICRRYGMRLVGPNCFGLALPGLGLDATFGADRPRAGTAGVVVQSGGVGVSFLAHLSRLGIGVSSFVSVGDKYDVSSNDMLTWWEQDGQTRLAVLYVESFGSPRKFARTARRVGQQMPVLTVISGRSPVGQRAAASHIAAAATPLVTQEALFAQAGIIACHSLGELTGAAALLASQPLPAGHRVAVISNAGGAGVLAADACGDHGLQVATLSKPAQRRLTGLLPPGAAVAGPVDTTAVVSVDAFRSALEEVAADDGVDAVLAVTVPTAIADLSRVLRTAQVTKPLAAALLEQPEDVRMLPSSGDGAVAADGEAPGGAGTPRAIPSYAYPEGAARALGHAARYRAWLGREQGSVPELEETRPDDARALVSAFLMTSAEGVWLPAAAVRDLLSAYRIPLVPTRRAAGAAEAVTAAAAFGGPAVLKAEVAGLVHKSDAGAVKLDLRGENEVRAAYDELAGTFGGKLERVLVQPMLGGGVEVLVGVVQEPVFGPLVVFGLGGVATEVLGDHAARLTPLTDADADRMIHDVHAASLLLGHRGSPVVDTAALADVLLRVSRLADDIPEIAELDLNPVIARPDGVQAVDARIRVAPVRPQDPFLRRLR